MLRKIRLQQFCSGPSSDLARCVTVYFLEETAEKLVVGKAVFVQDLEDRLIRRTDVVINMGQTHAVEVLRKGNPNILAEHTAEIVAVEAEMVRDLVEGQRFHVMFVNIGDDLLDPELAAAGFGQILLVKRYGEVLDQPVQHIESDRLCRDHIPLRLFDMKRDQVLEALADLQIGRNELVSQFSPAADDLEVALVAHEPLDEVVVYAEHDHHIGVRTPGFVDLVCIDDDKLTRYEPVLGAFEKEARVSVQNIDQFKGVVPVRRQVFAGRPIFYEDPLFRYIVVL